MTKRSLPVAVAALALLAVPGAPASAKGMSPKAFLKAVNGDPDKTLSKEEVDAYARKKFAEVETDSDKTLDAKELKGRVSAVGMSNADPDKDKTVDEGEFVGYADKLFDEANTHGSKTLSAKELATPAGKKLMMLLR